MLTSGPLGVQARHRFGDDLRREGFAAAEGHPAAAGVAERVQFVQRPVAGGEDGLGVAHQHGAVGGRPGHAARAAIQQDDPHLPLEIADGHAQGLLGQPQGPRGAGEAAVLDDGEKSMELFDLQRRTPRCAGTGSLADRTGRWQRPE